MATKGWERKREMNRKATAAAAAVAAITTEGNCRRPFKVIKFICVIHYCTDFLLLLHLLLPLLLLFRFIQTLLTTSQLPVGVWNFVLSVFFSFHFLSNSEFFWRNLPLSFIYSLLRSVIIIDIFVDSCLSFWSDQACLAWSFVQFLVRTFVAWKYTTLLYIVFRSVSTLCKDFGILCIGQCCCCGCCCRCCCYCCWIQ